MFLFCFQTRIVVSNKLFMSVTNGDELFVSICDAVLLQITCCGVL